ncbi:MAG: threonine/serine dehydratase [Gammaproteobacteria bacterium]
MSDTIIPAPDRIDAARNRLRGIAEVTPLLPLNLDDGGNIYLKLENLQPVGSFKLRTAANFMLELGPAERRRGVFTASSGNFGIAVAWLAARLKIAASVVVPDNAPSGKIETLLRLGATIHRVSYDEWWDVILNHEFRNLTAVFVDADGPAAMEANGTIGLEVLEQLPNVDTILAGYGSGALSCGIAAAVTARKPGVRVIACESATASPLAAAWRAGKPVDVAYQESFISGIGSTTVLPLIWPIARELLDGVAVVSLEQAAAAIRLLADNNRVIAEGAGAVPVAAAMAGHAHGRTVCVVSGGNIGAAQLSVILGGGIPAPDGPEETREDT